MKKQQRLEEYNKAMSEYRRRKCEILKEPEEKCHDLAEELSVYELRRKVEADVSALTKKAWALYKKIWGGSPDKEDIDAFISLADKIMQYEDFISADMLKVWQVSRDLIWAFGQSYSHKESDES